MTLHLKPLAQQVVVITGASSGIGLATARAAAARGARLVLAARSQDSLRRLGDELTAAGGEAIHVVADVSDPAAVRSIAERALERFGGFDTWINKAATGMYGRVEDTPLDDMRRLFDTNFWGLVHGSLEAVRHLRARGAGALINIGSAVSDRAIPLQGVYAASKHAVKAFTDALRMELEADGAPISVTLVKPGAIDTPFTVNAQNYLASQPKHVPPVYAPEAVARAILYCVEHPVRDVFAGAGGKGLSALGQYAPRVADRLMERFVIPGTESGEPAGQRDTGGLNRPSEQLRERGNYPGHVMKTSLYTEATLRPVLATSVVAGLGLALGALLRARSRTRH